MDDAEVEQLYNRMSNYYGDALPNWEQEPIRFAYYAKMFSYYLKADPNLGSQSRIKVNPNLES